MTQETAAIVIMGFIIWIISKAETVWRGSFRLKNASESAEEENQVLPTGERTTPFWKRKKTLLVVIVIRLIAGWIYYDRAQNEAQDERTCLQQIEYRGNAIYRIDGESGRNFKTQEEAMNYCLKVLN